MKNKPIGVFDSGIGGLAILDRLIAALPNEDFIYVADSGHFPYGTRPAAEIEALVTAVTRYLLNHNIKALVIACNTATAHSGHLPNLTDIPIIGMIAPAVRAAAAAVNTGAIAMLATNATVKAGVYQQYLARLTPSTKVIAVGCSEFADAIERGEINTAASYRLVAEKLAPYAETKIDVAILGCTHFDYYRQEIGAALPGARLISCADPAAAELVSALREKNLLKDDGKPGMITIDTTGEAAVVTKQIAWFKRPHRGVRHIDL